MPDMYLRMATKLLRLTSDEKKEAKREGQWTAGQRRSLIMQLVLLSSGLLEIKRRKIIYYFPTNVCMHV